MRFFDRYRGRRFVLARTQDRWLAFWWAVAIGSLSLHWLGKLYAYMTG